MNKHVGNPGFWDFDETGLQGTSGSRLTAGLRGTLPGGFTNLRFVPTADPQVGEFAQISSSGNYPDAQSADLTETPGTQAKLIAEDPVIQNDTTESSNGDTSAVAATARFAGIHFNAENLAPVVPASSNDSSGAVSEASDDTGFVFGRSGEEHPLSLLLMPQGTVNDSGPTPQAFVQLGEGVAVIRTSADLNAYFPAPSPVQPIDPDTKATQPAEPASEHCAGPAMLSTNVLVDSAMSSDKAAGGESTASALLDQALATATKDVDSTSFTYSLLTNPNGAFAIDNGGNITVAYGLALDNEQNRVQIITVRSTDPGGLSITKNFAITVNDVNPDNATGDANDNFVYGGPLDDNLNGGAGNDKLVAIAATTSTMWMRPARVFESVGGGIDTAFSSVSYALSAGQEIETLATTNVAGTGAIKFTGNELANRLIGNAGANTLIGGGGVDQPHGYGGADTLRATPEQHSLRRRRCRYLVGVPTTIALSLLLARRMGTRSWISRATV